MKIWRESTKLSVRGRVSASIAAVQGRFDWQPTLVRACVRHECSSKRGNGGNGREILGLRGECTPSLRRKTVPIGTSAGGILKAPTMTLPIAIVPALSSYGRSGVCAWAQHRILSNIRAFPRWRSRRSRTARANHRVDDRFKYSRCTGVPRIETRFVDARLQLWRDRVGSERVTGGRAGSASEHL